MPQTDPSFKADPDQRLTPPQALSLRQWQGRSLPFLGAFLIHASILSLLLFGPRLAPDVETAARDIPVEIIVEPRPPPTPEKPKPAPTLATPQIDLKSAYDAPRAANNETIVREAPDEATKAPSIATPTSLSDPGAAPAGAAGPTQQGALQSPQITDSASTDKPDAEVVPKRDENPDKQEKPQARTEAKPQPEKRAAPPGQRIPTFESVPDVDFGSAAAATPISGGKAKSTYLSILYAKIMGRLRIPPAARSGGRGAIAFTLDGFGNIIERRISRSSGSPALDGAALEAVGRAAPFPSPPQGMPIGLVFAYGEK